MDSYRNKREEIHKHKSKERLSRIMKKKIQTTTYCTEIVAQAK